MDFSFTKEQAMLMDSLRDMGKREKFAELGFEINEMKEFPGHLTEKFADMGLLGMTLPPEYGGEGESILTAVLAVEYLAKFSPVIAAPVFESNLGAVKTIDLFGTETQKKAILSAVCSGEISVSTGLTEPETNADVSSFQTVVDDKGGYLLLNGKKDGIIGSGEAAQFLVYVKFSSDPDRDQFGAVLVEKGMEGVTVGDPEKWMGLHGMTARGLIFNDVNIPKNNVVMNKKNSEEIRSIFGIEHCGYAAMCLGIGGGALEHARQHALERVAFGHTICDFQAIQLMIINMAMKLDAAKLLVYRAAAGEKKELPSFYDAVVAKCFACEMVKEITDLALQIFGGYGYSTEYPMERMLRDSRAWSFLGGTLEELKVATSAVVFKGK